MGDFSNKENKFVRGAEIKMIIIGLGNPGEKYENTRHNVGFMVLDKLSKSWKRGPNYLYSDINIFGEKVRLVKPTTYMNLSGEVFKYLPHDDIIVVYDDLDLPLGRIRIRKNGSAGGHNGIKSIISFIGQDFPRIRIGIGPKPQDVDAADYVLSNFSQEEFEKLEKVMELTIEAIKSIISEGIDKAMNKYNSATV
ncbi:peptidyl-tRNA hydrolase [Fervidobacterium gondwanense DSM 13020]|uniref:Peptidyl-tRNA hydrolase n=2 Tax=Fervidobacterium gondwanense TaxID=44754 RepID=A0A1M7S855_FERGO|nr:peptidyl-tRNA hydrolase [Fervidobacterium gondwanense DSM 13020]